MRNLMMMFYTDRISVVKPSKHIFFIVVSFLSSFETAVSLLPWAARFVPRLTTDMEICFFRRAVPSELRTPTD
jgi:hypothetical protein